MAQRVITLCYRKIIDAHVVKAWDKLVFEASFTEFRMQAQTIAASKPITSYAALLQQVPGASNLSARVSPSVTGYVRQLGGVIPELLNNIGKRFLKFSNFAFEIINSDIDDKSKHQVALNFYSEPLIWHDTVGNFLLLSAAEAGDEEAIAHLFQLIPYVNIHTIKSI